MEFYKNTARTLAECLHIIQLAFSSVLKNVGIDNNINLSTLVLFWNCYPSPRGMVTIFPLIMSRGSCVRTVPAFLGLTKKNI